MMNIKLITLAASLVAVAMSASAYDFVYDGAYYNVLSNTSSRKTAALTYATTNADATGYVSTYRGDVVIPAQVSYNLQTFKVTQVGDLAMFNNQGLYTLVLPEGISYIGNQAFSHCYSLYDMNIPSTVFRIGDYAFEYCEDLTSVTLPASLGDMGDGVFQQCFGLTEINVDEANEEYVSIDGVLYSGKGSASGIYLLSYPGGKKVKSFVMPDNVHGIDDYALSANRYLESITLGSGLKTIPQLTFSECESLAEINVVDGNESFKSTDGVLFDAEGDKLIQYPAARAGIAYELPEGVVTVGNASFYNARNIKEITLPSSLQLVEELSFYLANNIRSVTCKAIRPPKGLTSTVIPGGSMFDASVYKSGVLFVPAESVEAYKADSEWGRFSEIRSIGDSGIQGVDADNEPVKYYDMEGRSVENPQHGIYVVRRGNEITKEIVR